MTEEPGDDRPLEGTDLSPRTVRSLRDHCVCTVGTLREAHARVGYLMRLPGFGAKALREVEDLLGVPRTRSAPTDELIDATREYRAAAKRHHDLGLRFNEAEREFHAAVARFDAARRAAEQDVIVQSMNLRPNKDR